VVGDLLKEEVGKQIAAIIKIVQFVEGSGGAIGTTCVPLYMLALGISIEGFGIIFTISSLFSIITYFVIGAHSDKLGRKRYLVLGALTPPVIAVLYIFASDVTHFVILRVLSVISGAIYVAAYSPLIADIQKDSEAGRLWGGLFGFYQMGATLGGLVPAAIFGLYWTEVMQQVEQIDLRLFHLCFIAVALISGLRLLLLARYIPNIVPERIPAIVFSLKDMITHVPRNLAIICVLTFLSLIVIIPMDDYLVTIFAIQNLRATIFSFAIFRVGLSLLGAINNFVGEYITDRFSMRKTIAFLYVLMGIIIIFQPYTLIFSIFVLLYFSEKSFYWMSTPAVFAIETKNFRKERRGFDSALLQTSGIAGGMIGSFLVSLGLVSTLGFTTVFFLKAAAMLFYGLGIFFLVKED
jgi:MFS family permease